MLSVEEKKQKHREQVKRWKEKNKEKQKIYNQNYNKEHYEQNRERVRQWKRENKEKRNESARKYYDKNRNNILNKQRERRGTDKSSSLPKRSSKYKKNDGIKKERRSIINKITQQKVVKHSSKPAFRSEYPAIFGIPF